MERLDVTFPSGDDRIGAWLYRPTGEGPHPAIVLGSGLTGTREVTLDDYARRFCDAGLLALAFDYRGWGVSGGRLRDVVHVGRQLEDWRSAIAYVRSLEEVDPQRIALHGASFAGAHVAMMAAEDHRIAAAVSQCPFTDGRATASPDSAAGLAPRQALMLLGAAIRDELSQRLRGEPYRIPLTGSPGSVALITAPETVARFEAASAGLPVAESVGAGIMLQLLRYRPIKHVHKITCPWLVVIADDDEMVPARVVEKAAALAPRSEIVRYSGGHMDPFAKHFDQTVSDELDFLDRHLGFRGAGSAATGSAATAAV